MLPPARTMLSSFLSGYRKVHVGSQVMLEHRLPTPKPLAANVDYLRIKEVSFSSQMFGLVYNITNGVIINMKFVFNFTWKTISLNLETYRFIIRIKNILFAL